MSLFDTGIRPTVDDWLLKKSKETRDYGDYWSASSAGYCMRKVIFERLSVPPVNDDPRKQRVYSAGHIFHDWIQGITKDAGLSIAQEVELQDEGLMIRGHFDDLVLVNDKLIFYDYKTAHSKWFEYAKDQPISHYHKMQLGTYMYMLRKNKHIFAEHPHVKVRSRPFVADHLGIEESELTEARILKISKDDLRLHEQQLLWSDDLELRVTAYWEKLNAYWEKYQLDGSLPECTCALYEVNKKTGVGFMADEKWNPYYFNGEPCSLEWYEQWEANKVKEKV